LIISLDVLPHYSIWRTLTV